MFDIRRIQVHSLNEFLKEFAMIVIGILTAIAIEHVYTQSHKRHEAEQAAIRIRAEIAGNLKSADEAIAANEKITQKMTALEAQIVQGIESAPAREQRITAIKQLLGDSMSIGAHTIEPAQDAWDSALANQSTIHMPADDLRLFSRAYASQRGLNERQLAFRNGLNNGIWTRWNSATTDLQMTQGDPVDILKVVREFNRSVQSLNGALRQYADELKSIDTKKFASEHAHQG